MTDVQVHHAPTKMTHLGAEPALMISRSLHSDLDLEGVVNRLHTYVIALTPVHGVRYMNKNPDVDIKVGEIEGHHLSYTPKLTSRDSDVGTIHFYAANAMAEAVQEVIEELLSIAANALLNAFEYHAALAGMPKEPSNHTEARRKYEDALVLARVNGLDLVRKSEGDQWAEQVLTELKNRLGTSLRDADATMSVDEDHIAILLPCTPEQGAAQVARKLDTLIKNMDFLDPFLRAELSVSVGISSTSDAKSAANVLAQAKGKLEEKTSSQDGAVVH